MIFPMVWFHGLQIYSYNNNKQSIKMKYCALFATAFAISAANATFLPGLLGSLGGSSSGSTSSSGEGSAQPCDTSGEGSVETVYVSGCETGNCGGQASTGGSATTGGEASGSYDQSSSSTSEVPTDMFSQMIGGLSSLLETGFSGSGSLLHNLIG